MFNLTTCWQPLQTFCQSFVKRKWVVQCDLCCPLPISSSGRLWDRKAWRTCQWGPRWSTREPSRATVVAVRNIPDQAHCPVLVLGARWTSGPLGSTALLPTLERQGCSVWTVLLNDYRTRGKWSWRGEQAGWPGSSLPADDRLLLKYLDLENTPLVTMEFLWCTEPTTFPALVSGGRGLALHMPLAI